LRSVFDWSGWLTSQPVACEDKPFEALDSKEEKARWLRREVLDGTRVFAQSIL
jgi:hypothetical protein